MKCIECDKETDERCACGKPIHTWTKCHHEHAKEEIENPWEPFM